MILFIIKDLNYLDFVVVFDYFTPALIARFAAQIISHRRPTYFLNLSATNRMYKFEFLDYMINHTFLFSS